MTHSVVSGWGVGNGAVVAVGLGEIPISSGLGAVGDTVAVAVGLWETTISSGLGAVGGAVAAAVGLWEIPIGSGLVAVGIVGAALLHAAITRKRVAAAGNQRVMNNGWSRRACESKDL